MTNQMMRKAIMTVLVFSALMLNPGITAAVEISHEDVQNVLAKDYNTYTERDVSILKVTSDPRALERLFDMLDDPDCPKKSSAVEAVHTKDDPRIVPKLIKVLREDNNKYARSAAAVALGKIGDKRAVEPLIEIARKGINRIRVFNYPVDYYRSLEALGTLGDKRATDVLIKALHKEHYSMRKRIAYSLGQIGDKRAVEPLIEVLEGKHRTPFWLKAYLGGLGMFFNMFSAMGDTIGDREGAASALGEIGDPRAIEPLIRAMKSRNKYIKSEAIDALGNFNNPKVIEALTRELQRKDNYEYHYDLRQSLRKLNALN